MVVEKIFLEYHDVEEFKNGLNVTKNKDIDIVFDSIVKNALEFLLYSADEFEIQPKRSLIDFITALELFIKARLLKEHWTLLLDDLRKGKYANFVNGDLPTIDFKDAIDRLDNVLQEPLTNQEIKCFEKLRLHRNKLIHFYNKTYSGKSEKAKLNALTEIAEGWFCLHGLLKNKWYRDFAKYQKEIDDITKKIDKNKKAWQGKYNGFKNGIAMEIKKGVIFKECPICNFLAIKLEEYSEPIYEGRCLVCGQNDISLKVECSACGEIAYISDCDTACDCGKTDFTKEVLTEQLEVFMSPRDRAGENTDIYCTECFTYEPTVIELKNGIYFCLECFIYFDETSECEWCNTRYAGDIGEDTHWKGCENCEGSLGWHRND